MDHFYNRLSICYNNAILTKDITHKETILNRVLKLLKYFRIDSSLFNYLHTTDPKSFNDYLITIKKPYLILLTYDLDAIGQSINIPSDAYISYYDNAYHITYLDEIESHLSSRSGNEWY